jgi:hypothetical protein
MAITHYGMWEESSFGWSLGKWICGEKEKVSLDPSQERRKKYVILRGQREGIAKL